MPKRILMIAGEASGDIYGARLVQHLFRSEPTLAITGIGGAGMERSGMERYARAEDLGVVGLSEILPKMGVILRAYRKTRALIKDRRVDLVVLIDYPGFNMRIAKAAHRAGIPVIYYISPQVWAWKTWRVPLLAEHVSKMLVVFPFEEEIYRQAGLSCEFVGHPMLDDYEEFMTRSPYSQQDQKKRYGLDPERPVVGLFPGSRGSEISSLTGLFSEFARRIRSEDSRVQFLLAVAPTLNRRDLESRLSGISDLDIRWIEGDAHGALRASDVVVAASGTITLQAAIHEKPMVIVYRVSPFTYWMSRLLVRVPYFGLPNIVGGRAVVPELLQDAATPERIVGEVRKYLDDPDYSGQIRLALREVKDRLGRPGASARAAKIILDSL